MLVDEASTLVLYAAAVAAVMYIDLQKEEKDGNLSMEVRRNRVAQAGREVVERWSGTGVGRSCELGD